MDYNELSSLCEQSLIARSKPSLARTWLRRWKQDLWMSHLYGRILKPSLGQSFTKKWTSYLEGSLANLSQAQDQDKEMKTQDTFGHTLSKVLMNWEDLQSYFSKMSKESYPQSSRENIGQTPQERPFCSISYENWSEWVIKRRREYSQRAKLAQHIRESDYSFLGQTSTPKEESLSIANFNWRTPTLMEIRRCQYSNPNKLLTIEANGSQVSLFAQVLRYIPPQEATNNTLGSHQESRWATPRVSMSLAPQGGGDPTNKNYIFRIENQVQMTNQNWTTPTTMMTLGQRSLGALVHIATTQRRGRTSSSNLQEQVTPMTSNLYKEISALLVKYPQATTSQILESAEQKQIIPTTDPKFVIPYKKKLNPRWVEALMGLPIGWTAPSFTNLVIVGLTNYDFWEMELSQM